MATLTKKYPAENEPDYVLEPTDFDGTVWIEVSGVVVRLTAREDGVAIEAYPADMNALDAPTLLNTFVERED